MTIMRVIARAFVEQEKKKVEEIVNVNHASRSEL
jgi:hypothetical protein